MRLKVDREQDRVTIYFGEGRQSYEHGSTYLAMTQPAEVQVGFEGEDRLVFISIHPTSVLPSSLLERAEAEPPGSEEPPF